MALAGEDDRYLGLDLLRVVAGQHLSECAILLEIWKSGCLLLTSKAIVVGAGLDICLETGAVHATVDSCQQDAYGFVIGVTVNLPDGWFPDVYYPTNLLPKLTTIGTLTFGNLQAKKASGE